MFSLHFLSAYTSKLRDWFIYTITYPEVWNREKNNWNLVFLNIKAIIKSPDPLFSHRPVLFWKFSPCYTRRLSFKNAIYFREHELHTDIFFITQITLLRAYTGHKTLFPASAIFQVHLHQFCLLGISIFSLRRNPFYISNLQCLNISFFV
jgi:hypothetical protein